LAGQEGPQIVNALLNVLDDPYERIRAAGADGLAGREGTGVTEALLGLLGDLDQDVRDAAAEALVGREDALRALLKIFNGGGY